MNLLVVDASFSALCQSPSWYFLLELISKSGARGWFSSQKPVVMRDSMQKIKTSKLKETNILRDKAIGKLKPICVGWSNEPAATLLVLR